MRERCIVFLALFVWNDQVEDLLIGPRQVTCGYLRSHSRNICVDLRTHSEFIPDIFSFARDRRVVLAVKRDRDCGLYVALSCLRVKGLHAEHFDHEINHRLWSQLWNDLPLLEVPNEFLRLERDVVAAHVLVQVGVASLDKRSGAARMDYKDIPALPAQSPDGICFVRCEIVSKHNAPVLRPRLRADGQMSLEEVEYIIGGIGATAGGSDAHPRAVATATDVFAQAQLQLALFCLDVVFEHELAVRHFSLSHALLRFLKRREVRRPPHPRVAVALNQWNLHARNCERGGVLGAALVCVVRRLIKVFHLWVVAKDCEAQRPDAEDRLPEGLEAHRQQRLAALVLPVGSLHLKAIFALPACEPPRSGLKESRPDA